MKRPLVPSRREAWMRAALVGGAALALGCSSAEAPKAWNALSTCLAGKAAAEPLVTRVQHLRLIQLAHTAPNASQEAWPARCGSYADELYAALPSSGNGSLMRRKLGERFGCAEEKGSCKIVAGPTILSITTELWDAAKDSQLSVSEAPAGVPLPEASPAPLLDTKSWKSFSPKPAKLSGPVQTAEGRAVVLLKPAEGRARPTACEFSDGFGKLRCVEANAKVPELPAHTLEVVKDSSGLYAAGLTETGLVAYNLETGEESAVRGRTRRLVRDGIAVEAAAKEDIAQAGAPPGAPPAVKEEGFLAVPLKNGKAAKDLKLPTSLGDPITAGDHVVFLTQTARGVELNAMGLAGGRLKHEAKIQGPFSGAFHTCTKGEHVAVATWSGRAGLTGAKATAGEGKTQVALAMFKDGSWSKALETTLPFERAFDSELVCTATGASFAWAKNADVGVEIGRVDCTLDGCKANQVKLPGVESKWWWALAPLGDQVLVLWRSGLGETRLRAAPLASLATAKDTLVFDSPDFGGPNAGELSSILDESSALLVFRGEEPVALQISREGTPRLLSP